MRRFKNRKNPFVGYLYRYESGFLLTNGTFFVFVPRGSKQLVGAPVQDSAKRCAPTCLFVCPHFQGQRTVASFLYMQHAFAHGNPEFKVAEILATPIQILTPS